MGADRIAEITSHVQEVLDAPGESWCATFEVVGKDGAWAQVMKGSLNFAYPFAKAPDASDASASLPGATVAAWEAKNFATFAFDGTDARAVAVTIDRLFRKYFASENYSIEGRVEEL